MKSEEGEAISLKKSKKNILIGMQFEKIIYICRKKYMFLFLVKLNE